MDKKKKLLTKANHINILKLSFRYIYISQFALFWGGVVFDIIPKPNHEERKRNCYGRNTKIWGKCENYALFQQVPVGPIINNDNFQNNFFFYLKLIDIVVKIQARNIIEISNVEIIGFSLE